MDITITPRKLSGTIQAIPSKSQAHRLLICAAFADKPTELFCPETNRDIEATADCLNALGAKIRRTKDGYYVVPISNIPEKAELFCCESGSTLRFILPIVGALGVDAVINMAGRLPLRPLSPLWEEMERMGCSLNRPDFSVIHCKGKLKSGEFTIAGDVSSQFITGLLFATSLLDGESHITITGKLESAPYVTMTQRAMSLFGVDTEDFHVKGGRTYHSPEQVTVEGDWSNGAFWLSAKTLGSELEVTNLCDNSPQGDRMVTEYLSALEEYAVIDAAQNPDLVPVLAVVAGAKKGAKFINCARLRLKETDRLITTTAMILNLGGEADFQDDTLYVAATGYRGGTVDALNDHRIAMSAAVAATVSSGNVTILNAHEVKKSYPAFWDDYRKLGGGI